MKLLIGYDGSTPSDAALRDLESAGLPSKGIACVITAVLPVIPLQFLAPDSKTPGWYAAAYAEAAKNSKQLLAHARKTAEKAVWSLRASFPKWEIQVELVTEDPTHAILNKAEKWKPDLIVTGSHGRGGLDKLLLGSVAEKVSRHARGNVRIGKSRPGKKTAHPKVLVGFDGSRFAETTLTEVKNRNWPVGTEIRLVAVADNRLPLDPVMAAIAPTPNRKSSPVRWPWMEKKLAGAAGKLARSGVDVSTAIVGGDPRDALLSEARAFQANNVFLGSRGLSGIKRFFLGSVSSAVAARSPCSVEIIRKRSKM